MTENNQRGADGKEIALEARTASGAKLSSPSVARNRDVILDAFRKYMPNKGLMLEIGSGTGEHAAHICGALPGIEWQPSDIDEASRASIEAYGDDFKDGRMRLPMAIDVTQYGWWDTPDISAICGMVSINMIHIAPFAATEGLLRGAAALLQPGERLFLYGPFSRNSEMVESNQRFNEDLKRRDPAWGVRDLDDEIIPLATRHAFHLAAAEDVPANNMVVVLEKG